MATTRRHHQPKAQPGGPMGRTQPPGGVPPKADPASALAGSAAATQAPIQPDGVHAIIPSCSCFNSSALSRPHWKRKRLACHRQKHAEAAEVEVITLCGALQPAIRPAGRVGPRSKVLTRAIPGEPRYSTVAWRNIVVTCRDDPPHQAS